MSEPVGRTCLAVRRMRRIAFALRPIAPNSRPDFVNLPETPPPGNAIDTAEMGQSVTLEANRRGFRTRC